MVPPPLRDHNREAKHINTQPLTHTFYGPLDAPPIYPALTTSSADPAKRAGIFHGWKKRRLAPRPHIWL